MFAKSVLGPVSAHLCAVTGGTTTSSLKYSTILELDRRIKEFRAKYEGRIKSLRAIRSELLSGSASTVDNGSTGGNVRMNGEVENEEVRYGEVMQAVITEAYPEMGALLFILFVYPSAHTMQTLSLYNTPLQPVRRRASSSSLQPALQPICSVLSCRIPKCGCRTEVAARAG